MFEITPKEQILKNIRKGLVQPLPNAYSKLNFEQHVVENNMLMNDESFVSEWTKNGFLFQTYNGNYDLLNKIVDYLEQNNLGLIAINEPFLIQLFEENSISFLSLDKINQCFLSSFSKLETHTFSVYFNSEIQSLIHFQKAKHLILFGGSTNIEHPEHNKYFSELSIKNTSKVQLDMSYFKNFESVLLMIDETM